jgi:hypothetical protein
VGLPVYNGADLIANALDCLQQQTFGNFEAIISVDGDDQATAAACRPFLRDPRFRMIVHPNRLDWVGNFNWLLQQDLQEFFCYRQHDDTTAPEFFESLLHVADKDPYAAAIYSDCQYIGGDIEIFPSIEGEPLERVFQYVQRLSAVPVRGLIRRSAIQYAGLVRSDEFRAVLQIGGWLAKLLHWGSFKRVARPIYYRLYRADSLGNEYHFKSETWKQAAWPTMFTALLDAAMPICRTQEARLFMQQTIFDQIVAYPHFHPNADPHSFDSIVAKCLERVRQEGNLRLLDVHELPAILHGQKRRVETMLFERTRIRRALYESRQVSRLGKLIYPQSWIKRSRYQIRHLTNRMRRLVRMLIWRLAG